MSEALLNAAALSALLRERLPDATKVEVTDFSHRHAGHAGARPEGGSHFEVLVESPGFAGLSRLERSRRIHALLTRELGPGGIHALSLKLRAPGEGA